MRRRGRDRYTPAQARAAVALVAVRRCAEELRSTVDLPDDYTFRLSTLSFGLPRWRPSAVLGVGL